jgi:hypothetical protein
MDPAPARYMIRINGHLGATVLSAFPAMAPHHHGAHTVLTGLLDRSALYGVLAEIEAQTLRGPGGALDRQCRRRPGQPAVPDLADRLSTGPPPGQQEVLAIAEKWRPCRSLATSYLFSAASEPATGMRRIYEYCYPFEDARARRAYGVPSAVNNILIINKAITAERITAIIVNEHLGF